MVIFFLLSTCSSDHRGIINKRGYTASTYWFQKVINVNRTPTDIPLPLYIFFIQLYSSSVDKVTSGRYWSYIFRAVQLSDPITQMHSSASHGIKRGPFVMGLASLLTDSSLSALCCHFMMWLTSAFGPLSPACLGAAWSLGLVWVFRE